MAAARLTPTHQSNAFLNIHSHGDTVTVDFHKGGVHGHCHIWTQRSGCGIMARCRPSAEHRPAMPAGLPLGFIGYSVVGNPVSSVYCTGTRCWFWMDSKTSRLLKTTRPVNRKCRNAHKIKFHLFNKPATQIIDHLVVSARK